jgi:hypothetical protein
MRAFLRTKFEGDGGLKERRLAVQSLHVLGLPRVRSIGVDIASLDVFIPIDIQFRNGRGVGKMGVVRGAVQTLKGWRFFRRAFRSRTGANVPRLEGKACS